MKVAGRGSGGRMTLINKLGQFWMGLASGQEGHDKSL